VDRRIHNLLGGFERTDRNDLATIAANVRLDSQPIATTRATRIPIRRIQRAKSLATSRD
jgi:hypothetical protein